MYRIVFRTCNLLLSTLVYVRILAYISGYASFYRDPDIWALF